MLCPLCSSRETKFYWQDKQRAYQICSNCNLIFVPKKFHLTASKEKRRYDLHQNSSENLGYIKFLNSFLSPLKQKIKKSWIGLDYGSGPNPILVNLLNESGFNVQIFDPFYANYQKNLKASYHFITSTEVVEHFRDPKSQFSLLKSMLKENGLLAIMTSLHQGDLNHFKKWHYTRDQTHLAFYSKATFSYLAKIMNFKLEINNNIIFLKN